MLILEVKTLRIDRIKLIAEMARQDVTVNAAGLGVDPAALVERE